MSSHSKKKRTGKGKQGSSSTSAQPSAPTTITIRVKSKEGVTPSSHGSEEFGSVWFRNHNPNASSTASVGSSTPPPQGALVATNATSAPPPASNSTSMQPQSSGRRGNIGSVTTVNHLPPPPHPSQHHSSAGGSTSPIAAASSTAPSIVHDLSCVPPWARHRLPLQAPPPPTAAIPITTTMMSSSAPPFNISQTTAGPSSCVAPAAASTAQRPNCSAVTEDAVENTGGGALPPPPPFPSSPSSLLGGRYGIVPPTSSLYPYTIEGLSLEMYDFVAAMQLTQKERGARDALREAIERAVSSLWPAPSNSPMPPLASPLKTVAATEPSCSTPTLDSLVSSSPTTRTATPIPETTTDAAEDAPEAVSGGQGMNNADAHTSTSGCDGVSDDCGEGDSCEKLSAKVILFGSSALNLATPSSDLDLSVIFYNATTGVQLASGNGCGATSIAADGGAEMLSEEEIQFQRFTSKIASFEVLRLRELAEVLQKSNSSIEVKVLEECRVPVAHIIDLPSGTSADVSINMAHMSEVVAMQKAWLADEEQAERGSNGVVGPSSEGDGYCSKVRALIILTKLALRQWGLSCSFTGGLSSTGVYLLVERYLREGREVGCVPHPLPPLGRLAIDFWAYLSSDIFQHGFLATDIFHISNKNSCSTVAMGGLGSHGSASMSHAASVLSSPREKEVGANKEREGGPTILDATSAEYVPSPNNLSPVTADAPGGFPTSGAGFPTPPPPPPFPGILSRTASNSALMSAASCLLPDVTRRCTRMPEIQFFFRHSATALEQLVAPGPRNVWSLPPTPLSSILADPRQVIPITKRVQPIHKGVFRPNRNVPPYSPHQQHHKEEGRGLSEVRASSSEGGHTTPMPSSERSSTPGASSNGSDVGVSPTVQSTSSPVKFTSSLKNFVGAPCFVPKKLINVPPPDYNDAIAM